MGSQHLYIFNNNLVVATDRKYFFKNSTHSSAIIAGWLDLLLKGDVDQEMLDSASSIFFLAYFSSRFNKKTFIQPSHLRSDQYSTKSAKSHASCKASSYRTGESVCRHIGRGLSADWMLFEDFRQWPPFWRQNPDGYAQKSTTCILIESTIFSRKVCMNKSLDIEEDENLNIKKVSYVTVNVTFNGRPG